MNTYRSRFSRFWRLVLAAALLVSLATTSAVAQTAGSRGIGVVEFLEGDVKINGAEADFGQAVGYGDWVQTGPDGTIDIVFDRANIFRLGSNTVAKVEIGSARQSVDLKHGSFSAVFDRLRTLTGHGTFDLVTTTVAGGVRGTSFFAQVIDRQTTYFCTCNGTVELQAHGEDEAFINSADRHSAYYFRQGSDGVTRESAEMAYHSTEGLDEVADVIGVTIPWGRMPE